MQNFNTLASLCSWADLFESYSVANPADRFSYFRISGQISSQVSYEAQIM